MANCEVRGTVTSVHEFVTRVLKDTEAWSEYLIEGCTPWFRGQADIDKAPLPGICREYNRYVDEQGIAGRFVKLAKMFGEVPDRDSYAEWLFLMQHVGIPTRLLDWSEGALIGLYFAVENPMPECDPGVWVLNPLELNRRVLPGWQRDDEPSLQMFPEPGEPEFDARCARVFPRAHGVHTRADGVNLDELDIPFPIAIIPWHSHPRMKSQRGCFTLHGADPASIESVADEIGLLQGDCPALMKYRIPRDCARRMLYDLRTLGITKSTLFPDHDGLADDLKNAFREERRV